MEALAESRAVFTCTKKKRQDSASAQSISPVQLSSVQSSHSLIKNSSQRDNNLIAQQSGQLSSSPNLVCAIAKAGATPPVSINPRRHSNDPLWRRQHQSGPCRRAANAWSTLVQLSRLELPTLLKKTGIRQPRLGQRKDSSSRSDASLMLHCCLICLFTNYYALAVIFMRENSLPYQTVLFSAVPPAAYV